MLNCVNNIWGSWCGSDSLASWRDSICHTSCLHTTWTPIQMFLTSNRFCHTLCAFSGCHWARIQWRSGLLYYSPLLRVFQVSDDWQAIPASPASPHVFNWRNWLLCWSSCPSWRTRSHRVGQGQPADGPFLLSHLIKSHSKSESKKEKQIPHLQIKSFQYCQKYDE